MLKHIMINFFFILAVTANPLAAQESAKPKIVLWGTTHETPNTTAGFAERNLKYTIETHAVITGDFYVAMEGYRYTGAVKSSSITDWVQPSLQENTISSFFGTTMTNSTMASAPQYKKDQFKVFSDKYFVTNVDQINEKMTEHKYYDMSFGIEDDFVHQLADFLLSLKSQPKELRQEIYKRAFIDIMGDKTNHFRIAWDKYGLEAAKYFNFDELKSQKTFYNEFYDSINDYVEQLLAVDKDRRDDIVIDMDEAAIYMFSHILSIAVYQYLLNDKPAELMANFDHTVMEKLRSAVYEKNNNAIIYIMLDVRNKIFAGNLAAFYRNYSEKDNKSIVFIVGRDHVKGLKEILIKEYSFNDNAIETYNDVDVDLNQ